MKKYNVEQRKEKAKRKKGVSEAVSISLHHN